VQKTMRTLTDFRVVSDIDERFASLAVERLDQIKNLLGACCLPKPALTKRELIAPELASELAEVFKVLANDTRLRLLHSIAATVSFQSRGWPKSSK
jgi:hypothetical protein